MRDPKRIRPFLKEFGDLWEQHPDLRFGQLAYSLNHKICEDEDIFEIEDDKYLERIKNLKNNNQISNIEVGTSQKSAIDKVKEAIKEYETELKNLENIQYSLDTNLKHMDQTSQKYKDGLHDEIEILNYKNILSQLDTNFYNFKTENLPIKKEIVNNNLLQKAIEIALQAHKGQTDKGGHDYILHPFRVACNCDTNDERIVAVLHDTIEDTDITYDYLSKLDFPEYIIAAINSVIGRFIH